MTVRRRLFWSNILMIAVPAVITALVGVLCAGMIFWVLRGDGGLGVEDHGDLSWLGSAAAEAAPARRRQAARSCWPASPTICAPP